MGVSAAIMDIAQVDVEAYQKQGFGRIPHVSPDYLTICNAYAYLNNRPHQWIEISVFWERR
jgi:hypothetical protein